VPAAVLILVGDVKEEPLDKGLVSLHGRLEGGRLFYCDWLLGWLLLADKGLRGMHVGKLGLLGTLGVGLRVVGVVTLEGLGFRIV
jgi:hypothetical protein